MNRITLNKVLPKKQTNRPTIKNTAKRAHLLFSTAFQRAEILPTGHADFELN
jgi:hypothetical protein